MILITGLPNAGKTTYSKQFPNVVHLDDFMKRGRRADEVFTLANAAAKSCGDDVVVEGVYLKRFRREALIKLFPDAHNVCIFLDTDAKECKRRENRRRLGVVEHWEKSMELPVMEEGWDEIIII